MVDGFKPSQRKARSHRSHAINQPIQGYPRHLENWDHRFTDYTSNMLQAWHGPKNHPHCCLGFSLSDYLKKSAKKHMFGRIMLKHVETSAIWAQSPFASFTLSNMARSSVSPKVSSQKHPLHHHPRPWRCRWHRLKTVWSGGNCQRQKLPCGKTSPRKAPELRATDGNDWHENHEMTVRFLGNPPIFNGKIHYFYGHLQ